MSIARTSSAFLLVVAAALPAFALVWSRDRRGRIEQPRAEKVSLHPPVVIVASTHAMRWSFSYPGSDGAIGTADDLTSAGELHLPLESQVDLLVKSDDYLCTLSVPELGLRELAIPDLPSSVSVRPARAGRFELSGDPLCGGRPTRGGRLIVESRPEFEAWLGSIRSGRGNRWPR